MRLLLIAGALAVVAGLPAQIDIPASDAPFALRPVACHGDDPVLQSDFHAFVVPRFARYALQGREPVLFTIPADRLSSRNTPSIPVPGHREKCVFSRLLLQQDPSKDRAPPTLSGWFLAARFFLT
jgi:hypothetical protein